MNDSTQSGFTLIELVVVIVMLGILAAIALPRLVSMEGEARSAVVDSLYDSLRSGARMVHARAEAAGQLASDNVSVDIGGGVTVDARYGYPNTNSNANIEALFEDLSIRVTVSGNGDTRNIWVDGRANCGVVYQRADNAGDQPLITPHKSGCH